MNKKGLAIAMATITITVSCLSFYAGYRIGKASTKVVEKGIYSTMTGRKSLTDAEAKNMPLDTAVSTCMDKQSSTVRTNTLTILKPLKDYVTVKTDYSINLANDNGDITILDISKKESYKMSINIYTADGYKSIADTAVKLLKDVKNSEEVAAWLNSDSVTPKFSAKASTNTVALKHSKIDVTAKSSSADGNTEYVTIDIAISK